MDRIKQFEPIFGEWYVESFIGAGSFGRVYKIYRNEGGIRRYSALKCISIPTEESEIKHLRADGMNNDSISNYYNSLAKSISAETTLMSKLRGNENIVNFEDSVSIPKAGGIGCDILIRMELLESLTNRIAEAPLSKEDVLDLGIDICSSLVLCSGEGILHRDIKPDNIFIAPNGDYKLGDFGIARQLEKTATFMSKKGTYNYMAPEVYKGERYGAQCDIYSLGIVMYRLLNGGRLPLLPPIPQQILPDDRESALVRRMGGEALPAPINASPEFAKIVLKACAYKPEDRYASAAEMREALIAYKESLVHPVDALESTAGQAQSNSTSARGTVAFSGSDETISFTQNVLNSEAESGASTTDHSHSVGGNTLAVFPQHRTSSPKGKTADSTHSVQDAHNVRYIESTAANVNSTLVDSKNSRKKTGLILGIAAGFCLLAGVIALALAGVFGKSSRVNGKQGAAHVTAAPTFTTAPAIAPTPSLDQTAAPEHTLVPPSDVPTAFSVPTPSHTPTPSPTPTPNPVVFSNSTFEQAFRNRYGITGSIRHSDLLDYSELELVDCGLTDITDVALFKNLTVLKLYGNNISNISPLRELAKLKHLDLDYNPIADFSPLRGLTSLNVLYLDETHMTDISALESLTALKELALNNNPISDFSVIGKLTRLETVWLSSLNISDVSFLKNLRSLKKLYLWDNKISNLEPISGLTDLRVLHLENNLITNISALSGMTKLQKLVLHTNGISDISKLKGLINLEYLSLSFNKITSVTALSGLANLNELFLSGNPIPTEQVDKLKAQLPNCVVQF